MNPAIPGTVHVRYGSPVLFDAETQAIVGASRGLVHAVLGLEVRVVPDPPSYVSATPVYVLPLSAVSLDITDPTGRVHAAWWLQSRLDQNPRYSLVGPHVWPVDNRTKPIVVGFTIGLGHVFVSRNPPNPNVHRMRPTDEKRHVVADLADLDPADPRLLPDGSRWVDAEALRRVVLHVAEMQS